MFSFRVSFQILFSLCIPFHLQVETFWCVALLFCPLRDSFDPVFR